MRNVLVVLQALTFFALGGCLVGSQPKLAAAQVLLGIVTVLVYAA